MNFSNIFGNNGNMKIGLLFAVGFESPDLKTGILLAILKHSGKILSDGELLKSNETVYPEWPHRQCVGLAF